ncbi:MAG: hypothetical protein ACK4YP_18180, partial [Myxococcota bacterium]
LQVPALVLVAGLGALAVDTSLPRADATRVARTADQALLFVPDAHMVRAASTGFEEPLADLFWVRTVLVFGERFGTEAGDAWLQWLGRMIEAVYTLDPKWRTPYFYGGTILRVSGDVDGSDAVFQAAHANLPDDPFFPFSLGMNAYLYRDDARVAVELIGRAAELPGAPSWYSAAAAAMRQQSGERAAGIQYLEEVRRTTTDPAILADTDRQLARLRHNDLVETWADACRRWRDANGPLSAPGEIARLGFTLPPNPRGDAWVVGADGVVRSEGAEKERYRRLLIEERKIVAP